MTDPKPLPTQRPPARTEREARRLREAAALRANLLRRKQQQRARAAAPAETPADDVPCR